MTLIEVLVAMAVLGTAVASLISLFSLQTGNTAVLEDHLLARIVAENAMVEVVTNDAAGVRQDQGGQVTLAGRDYEWAATRTPSAYEGIDVLAVSVRYEDTDRELTSLTTLKRAE